MIFDNKITLLFLLLLAIVFFQSNASSHEFFADHVNFDEHEVGMINDLEKVVDQYFDETYKNLPYSIRSSIEQNKIEHFHDFSVEDGQRIQMYLMGDKLINLRLSNVRSWSKFHDDDFTEIMWTALLNHVSKKNHNLETDIAKFMMIFRENRKPLFQLSPDAQSVINWSWQFETDKRKYGVIHIGIDEKKRNFLCYECDVGIYYPEGELLERIYTEIVQDPDMAGIWLGKGRKERLEKEKKETKEKG